MPDVALRAALLDLATSLERAGMPKSARIAARLASGRPPVEGPVEGADVLDGPEAECRPTSLAVTGAPGGPPR